MEVEEGVEPEPAATTGNNSQLEEARDGGICYRHKGRNATSVTNSMLPYNTT